MIEGNGEIAPESDQIKKFRAKLSASLDAQAQIVNDKTLSKVKEVNKAQHHRNTRLRETVSLDSKPLSLFAEGIGVKTDASSKVLAISKRMQEQYDQQYAEYQRHLAPMTIKPLDVDS